MLQSRIPWHCRGIATQVDAFVQKACPICNVALDLTHSVAEGTKFRFAKFCVMLHSIVLHIWMREQKWSSSAFNDGRDPLFSTIFSRTCEDSSIDLLQKCSAILLGTSTDRQTDRFWPDPEAGGSRFRLPKVPVSPQVALKTGPIHKSQILLTSRLKSTSGALPRLHSLKIAPSAQ